MNYRIDEDKLRGALKKGVRRARVQAITGGAALALVVLITLTTIGAAISPAFAEQLSRLPVIGRVIELFRPGHAVREAFERGEGELLNLTTQNEHIELAVDALLATDDGFTIIYRTRWLKLPEGETSGRDMFLRGDYPYLRLIETNGEYDWPSGAGGSHAEPDSDGWIVSEQAIEGTFGSAVKAVFGMEMDDDHSFKPSPYDIVLELPLARSDLPVRTVELHQTVGAYELGALTISTHGATLSYTGPESESYDGIESRVGRPMMFLTDEGGRLWFETSSSGGVPEGSGREAVEVRFESPYFADSALALHIVDGASERYQADPVDYHITRDGQGGFGVPDDLELVASEHTESGDLLTLRIPVIDAGARGFLAGLNDQSFHYIEGNAQLFSFEFRRDADELWLSSAVWDEGDETIVPLG